MLSDLRQCVPDRPLGLMRPYPSSIDLVRQGRFRRETDPVAKNPQERSDIFAAEVVPLWNRAEYFLDFRNDNGKAFGEGAP